MNLKDVLFWLGLAAGAAALIIAFLYFQKNIRPKNPNHKPGDGLNKKIPCAFPDPPDLPDVIKRQNPKT